MLSEKLFIERELRLSTPVVDEIKFLALVRANERRILVPRWDV